MPRKRKTTPADDPPPLTDDGIIQRYLLIPSFDAAMNRLARPASAAELLALETSTRETLERERYALCRRLTFDGLCRLLKVFGRKYDKQLWTDRDHEALAEHEDSRPALRDWQARYDACMALAAETEERARKRVARGDAARKSNPGDTGRTNRRKKERLVMVEAFVAYAKRLPVNPDTFEKFARTYRKTREARLKTEHLLNHLWNALQKPKVNVRFSGVEESEEKELKEKLRPLLKKKI